MRLTATQQIVSLSLLAATTLLASLLCLLALNTGGRVAVGPLGLMDLAAGYDRSAEPRLRGPALLQHRSREAAAAESRAAIQQYPYDTSAWLRLAYVDTLNGGGLSPAGLGYLKRSYDLVAVDSYVGVWRIQFALENSQSLTPELRSAVHNEVASLWRNGENRGALHAAAEQVRNPAGRLSLLLWLSRLETTPDK